MRNVLILSVLVLLSSSSAAADVSPSAASGLDGIPGALHFPIGWYTKGFTLTNLSSEPVTWTATSSEPWLSVEPAGGDLGVGAPVNFVRVLVRVDREGLPVGVFNGEVQILCNGQATTIDVTLDVDGPELAVTPRSLYFPYFSSGRIVTLTNTGFEPTEWSCFHSPDFNPWIRVSRTFGTIDPGESFDVAVNVDWFTIPPGTRTGFVYFGNAFGDHEVNIRAEGSPVATKPTTWGAVKALYATPVVKSARSSKR